MGIKQQRTTCVLTRHCSCGGSQAEQCLDDLCPFVDQEVIGVRDTCTLDERRQRTTELTLRPPRRQDLRSDTVV